MSQNIFFCPNTTPIKVPRWSDKVLKIAKNPFFRFHPPPRITWSGPTLYIYIPFFKISWKNQKICFLNVNYVIGPSEVILIDVLWSGHPYWPIVSIFRISKSEILMIFWHSHANTWTNQKIIWSEVYQNHSEVSSNISAIPWYFYDGLGPSSRSEIAF